MNRCIILQSTLPTHLVVGIQSDIGFVIMEQIALHAPFVCLTLMMSIAACTVDQDNAAAQAEVTTNHNHLKPPPDKSEQHTRLDGANGGLDSESAMANTVSVSLLLHKQARTPKDFETVKQRLVELGATSVIDGRVSLSCRMPAEAFRRAFAASVSKVDAALPKKSAVSDSGSPAGYQLQGPVSIPASLADYVESVSVEPPAVRLQSERGEQNHGEKK